MKRTVRAAAVIALATSFLAGCVMNRINPDPQTIVLREQDEGEPVRIEIAAGPEWVSRTQAGPVVFNVIPQFAVWTEDEAGRFVETLYVTGAGFGKLRHAKKQEMQSAFFAECLPVWSARVLVSGGRLPSKANPYPDAVTSATPSGPATIVTALERTASPVTVYLEINKSNDANATYTEEDYGWVGQPSLIYAAEIDGTSPDGAYRFALAGHGGAGDSAARLSTGVEGFDTALELVKEPLVLVGDAAR
ncbi:MAG: hypothetical protein ACOCVK_01900 [bacterium]